MAWIRAHARIPDEVPAEACSFEVDLGDAERAWEVFDRLTAILIAASRLRREGGA